MAPHKITRRMDTDMDRIAALRAERLALLDYCRALSPEEWSTPSAASGWSVQDVVAHMGGAAREPFTPRMVTLWTARSIERHNDDAVARRSGCAPSQVLGEYERWSRRLARLQSVSATTPVGRIPFKIAELGRFPMSLVTGALVFDTYTHLRHDIVPVIGRQVPAADTNRVAVVLEWMMAAAERCHTTASGWIDAPIALSLTGPGGGSWRIDGAPVGAPLGRLRIRPGEPAGTVAQVVGRAEGFPAWGTRRTPWREADVQVTGNVDYGERFLDALNVI